MAAGDHVVKNDLTVENNAAVTGTLAVTGAASLADALSVDGALEANSTLNVDGLATLNSMSVTNNGTVGGTLDVTGRTTVSDLTATGEITDKQSNKLLYPEVFWCQEQRSNGTAGPTYSTGAWRTVECNTSVLNEITGASLASDQLTLPAGTYDVMTHMSAPGRTSGPGIYHTRFYDTTNTTVLAWGLNDHARPGTYTQPAGGSIIGRFTLSAQAVCEFQVYPNSTSTAGQLANGHADIEVYTNIFLKRVAT